MARRFFYVCAGLLCLAIAFQMGAKSAGATIGGQIVSIAFEGGRLVAVTSDGDVYSRLVSGDPTGGLLFAPVPMSELGNYWTANAPTPAKTSSFGAVKARYR